jgi:organic radical activating enzyme
MFKKKTYPISEIFYSIQGEGSNAGTAAIFVRFSGCNLSCPWCDTDHRERSRMTRKELVGSIRQCQGRRQEGLLVWTGGEPLVHLDARLVEQVNQLGFQQAIETNGTIPILKRIRAVCWVTISPKLEKGPVLEPVEIDEVKVVLAPGVDPERYVSLGPRRFIQPCSMKLGPAVEYVKAHPWWRLSIQTQKLLNTP